MGTKSEDSFLAGSPSWALAVVSLIGATIVQFVVDELVHSFDEVGISAIFLFELLAAAACFFIIRQNPKSVWYVPLIINSLLILSAIVEPNFWIPPPNPFRITVWIPACSGWVLCLVVSTIAAVKGKQTPVPSSDSRKPIGSNTPWICPKCKHKNAYWDEYCGNCGESR